jgi:hypothetical protein
VVVLHYVKFSFECEQKFEIEPEIVDKIVTLTIFTFVKGIKLILRGKIKNTRTLMDKNKIFVNAVEMSTRTYREFFYFTEHTIHGSVSLVAYFK